MAFPTPMPDEALLSVIQRAVVLDTAATERKAAKRLFNSSSLQFCSPFPSCIPAIAELSGMTGHYWIQRHTILPVFRALTPVSRYVDAYQNLLNGKGDAVFKSLSLIANRQCNTGAMRFCSECAEEDSKEVGLAYWHVEHQLPGTFVCAKHKIRLMSTPVSRKRFDNWPHRGVAFRHLASKIEMKLVRFACYFQYHSSERFRHYLCDIYKARLHDMGFLTKCAHVRLKQLRLSMIEALKPVLDYSEVKGIFDDARYPLYPSSVLTNRDAAISPLKHLLMMTFLFDSVSDLLNSDIECSPEVVQASTNPNANDELSSDIDDIIHALKRGDSLRCVAGSTEHSVAYVKKVALTTGVAIETREQKLFATERRQIAIKLLAGKSTEDIAKDFNCSKGAIEKILSQHPDIVTLRRRRRKYAKMKLMRQSLLETIKSITTPRRQDVKYENHVAYLWLYKNDRHWLYAHLPKAIPRNLRRRKPVSDESHI
ncbi:hypothetical protein BM528_15670 [Alteromonas sp. RW2A1]|uniref:TnsD family Tn7-like transposition protein n=1 Tax=Alteromonas sp. RW2A1 TaxID=1917158 RepID=UPI000903EE30|nr:TnsD family Tn7-like transposition protein [Alteromonas sp. RW2A1]APE07040.1 hypothetical protein BM528_15670 [Alteromonas sp. RW2A1]